MKQIPQTLAVCFAAVLLGLGSTASAHGHEGSIDMDTANPSVTRPTITTAPYASPQSYFQYGAHSGLLFAHITLMSVAWIFILPIGVLFSIARSRYSLPVQFAFLATNAVGVFLVTIYNASTPDLYPNNAHHKIGWILTWVTGAQVVLGVISAYVRRKGPSHTDERAAFIPISTEAMAEHQRLHCATYRFSNDSGQGTEPNTESLRSQSISSQGSDHQISDVGQGFEEDLPHEEKPGLTRSSKIDGFLKTRLPGALSSRILSILRFLHNCVDRVILPFGFLGLTTGFITYGGLFMGAQVFSGLAHFIKGGVFFWYGILTLGRWAGCFSEIGWAWNISPSRKARPTAEFVESFLIFFYGSTNVFLEHLAAWGNAWSAQDLEHLSITFMFLGGGMCGMLIESKRVRGLLNATKDFKNESELEEPKSYRFSMNPIPALIVMLLGFMMSSHHQDSMVSTMIHKQWGTLLVGAAFARAATYIVFYLSPPTSLFPGRPPTELITAFCLMAGGLIFMASARDIVLAMDAHSLDAMFVFTLSMGFITFLMAWIVFVIALKGWAVRKENVINNRRSPFAAYRHMNAA